MSIPFEKDEWEVWRAHPLTQWLLDDFLEGEADEALNEFMRYAWGRAGNDPAIHASLFERHKVLTELRLLDYEDIEAHYNIREQKRHTAA